MNRALVLVLCAGGLGLAWIDHRVYAEGQESARALIELYGLDARYPELADDVRRRYDPVAAELRVAQALLADELDRRWLRELTEDEARRELERSPERLAEATRIARRSWPRRPTLWQAPMVLGGSTYLARLRSRDPRFLGEPEAWRAPLVAAQSLGPTEPAPVRFLAAAELGNWASLDRAARAETIALLGRAFRDPETFRLLIGDWLRIAPSRSEALELVPDRPWAWHVLQERFATAGDWELWIHARERWYASLPGDVEDELDGARRELAAGQRRDARSRLLRLAQRLPRSLDYAPELERIVELLPPGPVGGSSAETFAAWLERAVDACLLRSCPFGDATVSRLARLAGELPAETRAAATLLAGDLPRAELIERRFAVELDDGWNRFRLMKADHLVRVGRLDEARVSLERVPASTRRGPLYWRIERDLAAAADDAERRAVAESELRRLGRERWTASDWRRDEGLFRLSVWPARPARGLSLAIDGAPGAGSVVEVHWNGRLLAIERTTRTPASLQLETPVEQSIGQLSVRFRAGGSVRPGAVELF